MTGNLKLFISTHRSLTCARLLHSNIIIININIIIIINNININININIIIIINHHHHPSSISIHHRDYRKILPRTLLFSPLDWLIVVTPRLPYPL